MTTLEMMRKDYKDDADIIKELTNAADTVVDFDRTWNGKYELVRCAECNGPIFSATDREFSKGNPYEISYSTPF